MARFKEGWILLIPILFAAGLSIFAYAHKLQLNDLETYRKSVYIPIEFFFLLTSIVGLFWVFVFILVSAFKRQLRLVLLGIVSLVATYLLIALGMYLDSATLIYMT